MREDTHLQADLPLLSPALLGQFAQVHWPGGQEQVSPHEQADLPLFLAGQFSHVHWPGGHVHSVPHLYCQLSPLIRRGQCGETYEQPEALLSLEGHPSQEHAPGGQEHLSPQLHISPKFLMTI